MSTGVRVELRVTTAPRCSLVDVADDTTLHSVSRARDADGPAVTEFVADPPVADVEKVFDYGPEAVYRISDDDGRPCVCDQVRQLGYPVREYRVEDGTVTIAFFVPDIDALRSVVEALAVDARQVSIRRLTRSGSDADGELVLVDRGELTDRQREVLQTAERMGYFEHPKSANAGEVADELDIATSTFAEHLSAAQRKLLPAVLD